MFNNYKKLLVIIAVASLIVSALSVCASIALWLMDKRQSLLDDGTCCYEIE